MSTWQTVLAVGFALVLPQVVGFAAMRLARRLPASVWPLAAAGTVAVFWAISMFSEHRAAEHARAAGQFRCGTAAVGNVVAFFLLGAHFVLGCILGTLDWRARGLYRRDGSSGRGDSPSAPG